jgi:uncharacterized protein YdhG (YjbR/CyaY superfamily)
MVKQSPGFSKEERAAMQARAKELAAEARSSKSKVQGEKEVLEAIAAMPQPDRNLAKRIHALVKKNTPSLLPKTWYGMPAYANKDGKAVCFFQSGKKFKSRYATLGFSDAAKLDSGEMWPTSFALKKLTVSTEKKIVTLLKLAVS